MHSCQVSLDDLAYWRTKLTLALYKMLYYIDSVGSPAYYECLEVVS
jgi:hypothetical protein